MILNNNDQTPVKAYGTNLPNTEEITYLDSKVRVESRWWRRRRHQEQIEQSKKCYEGSKQHLEVKPVLYKNQT